MLLLLFAVWRRESRAASAARRRALDRPRASSRSSPSSPRCTGAGSAHATGPIAVDNFRWMMDVIILLGTIGALALGIDDNDRAGTTTAETHVLILLASSGMMLLAAARDLMIVFLGIELMSISVYALAGLNRRSERVGRGRAQVLPARRLLHGVPALRHRARLRRHRRDRPARDRRARRCERSGDEPDPADRHRDAARRLRLQGLHGAVPHVGAGRLRRLAEPDHGVHGGHGEDRGVRRLPPRLARGVPERVRRAGTAPSRASRSRRWSSATRSDCSSATSSACSPTRRSRTRDSSSSPSPRARRRARRRCCSTCSPTRWRRSAPSRSSSCCRAATTPVTTDDLSGLWTVRPWLAVAMTVFMLSLMGFPIFGGAGFLAKWFVLKAALQAPQPQIALAVVLVLTTVISAGYYLYVVMVMFMRPRIRVGRRADGDAGVDAVRHGRLRDGDPRARRDAGVFRALRERRPAADRRSSARAPSTRPLLRPDQLHASATVTAAGPRVGPACSSALPDSTWPSRPASSARTTSAASSIGI